MLKDILHNVILNYVQSGPNVPFITPIYLTYCGFNPNLSHSININLKLITVFLIIKITNGKTT